MSDTLIFNTDDALKNEPVKIKQIATFKLVAPNHPALHKVLPEFDFNNPPVNPNEFASTLVETCKLNKGIGLSANQCGFEHRVFVMGAGDEYVAFFNPKIMMASEEQEHMEEGCLSFPLLSLRITRPKEIMVEYQDFNGQIRNTKFVGISARCFQHELDHMNGIVYTNKVKPLALQMAVKKRDKAFKTFEKMTKKLAQIKNNGNSNRIR
jgi:peptide deformylase